MIYKYGVLDPRPNADNDKHFDGPTMGIEVTVPALAERCDQGNIDPQHTKSQSLARCAIEMAAVMQLPAPGTRLVTVRADLDSVGAMAVLEIRRRYEHETAMLAWAGYHARVEQVIKADTFNNGSWPGARPMPTILEFNEGEGLAGIARAVSDFHATIEIRVAAMMNWLIDGDAPPAHEREARREHESMVSALESGAIDVKSYRARKFPIAVVTSQHRSAMSIGYRVAPVVIAINPSFVVPGWPGASQGDDCAVSARVHRPGCGAG